MGRLAGAGQRPEAHAEAAWAVAWRAGGGGLLTGAADGAVKFWRVGADGEGAPTVEEEVPKARSASPLGVVAVAAGPDEGGAGAATTLESRLHVWDAAGVGTELALPPSEAWGLAFCPDGVVAVASGSAGGWSPRGPSGCPGSWPWGPLAERRATARASL